MFPIDDLSPVSSIEHDPIHSTRSDPVHTTSHDPVHAARPYPVHTTRPNPIKHTDDRKEAQDGSARSKILTDDTPNPNDSRTDVTPERNTVNHPPVRRVVDPYDELTPTPRTPPRISSNDLEYRPAAMFPIDDLSPVSSIEHDPIHSTRSDPVHTTSHDPVHATRPYPVHTTRPNPIHNIPPDPIPHVYPRTPPRGPSDLKHMPIRQVSPRRSTRPNLVATADLKEVKNLRRFHFGVRLVPQGRNQRMTQREIDRFVKQFKDLTLIQYHFGRVSHWTNADYLPCTIDGTSVYKFKYSAIDSKHWQLIQKRFLLRLDALNRAYRTHIHAKVHQVSEGCIEVFVIIWYASGVCLDRFIDALKADVQSLKLEYTDAKEVVHKIETTCSEISLVGEIPRYLQTPPPLVALELGFIQETSVRAEDLNTGKKSVSQVVLSCDENTMQRWLRADFRRSRYNQYRNVHVPLQEVVLVEPKIKDLINAFPAQRLRELAKIVSCYIRNYRGGPKMILFEIIVQYMGLRSYEAPSALPWEDKNSFKYYIMEQGDRRKMASMEIFEEVRDNGFWETQIQAKEAEPWDFYKKWCVDLKLAEENKETKEITWLPSKRRQREVIKLLTAYVLSRDKESTQANPDSKQADTDAKQDPDEAKGTQSDEPDDNRVVVFDMYIILINRFGYGEEMIRKARKFYMEEYEDEEKVVRLRMVPWYHGVLSDRQTAKIMQREENAGKFLLREKFVNDSKSLAVEYSNLVKQPLRGYKKKALFITPRGFQWMVSTKPSQTSTEESEGVSRVKTEEEIKNALRRKASSIEMLHKNIIQAYSGPVATRLQTATTIQEAVREITRRSSDRSERKPILPGNYMKPYGFFKKTAEVELKAQSIYFRRIYKKDAE